MTMTGSLMNRIGEQSAIVTPEIGMGATGFGYSDRYPYTVVEVKSKARIVVQSDFYKLEPWPSGYGIEESYKADTEGELITLVKTAKGWKEFKGSMRFALGFRQAYSDPSF